MNRRNRISKLNESFTFRKSGRTEPTFWGLSYFLGIVLLFGFCPTNPTFLGLFLLLYYFSAFFSLLFGIFFLYFSAFFVLEWHFYEIKVLKSVSEHKIADFLLKFLVFRPSLMLRYLWGTRITIATFSGVYHCPMGRLCSLCYNRGQKGKAKLSESAVKIQKIFCLSKCFYGN